MREKPEEAFIKVIDGQVYVGTADGAGSVVWGIRFDAARAKQFGDAILLAARQARGVMVIDGTSIRLN